MRESAFRAASLAVLGVGASLAFVAGLYRIRTFDTFFHLATGRLILERGAVPATDPFSFTFPGALWRNHSWGYQVVLERLHELGGFPALSLLQAVLALSLFGLTVWHVGRTSTLKRWAVVLSVLPMVAHREVLEARPHMVGFVLLALALLIVERMRTGMRAVFAMIPLHTAWATLHASHVLVLLIAAVVAVEALWQRRWRDACAWSFVMACALGVTAWLAPISFDLSGDHFSSEFMGSTVKEWQPVSGQYLLHWPGRAFVIVAVLSLLGLLLAHTEADEAQAVPRGFVTATLLLLFLGLAYTSLRMVALFMFGTQPLWVPYASLALRKIVQLVRLTRVELALVAAALVALTIPIAWPAEFQLGAGLARDRFPEAAVRHMQARGRISRVYNAFNFGGYLMWAGVPVFVDSRAITVYPSSFLATFDSAYADVATFERLAQRYAVDGVLLPTTSPRVQQLRGYLSQSTRWERTHHDDVAEVFEERRN